MGLWSGFNTSIQAVPDVDEKEMSMAHRLAAKAEKKIVAGAKFVGRETADVARSAQRGASQVVRDVTSPQARFAVGKSVGQAVMAGRRPSFSREEEMLQSMFGQGEHVWGNIGEPVRINNDLHPSMNNNPFEEQTSDIFGFGNGGEKSGLF